MKNLTALLLVFFISLTSLVACSKAGAKGAPQGNIPEPIPNTIGIQFTGTPSTLIDIVPIEYSSDDYYFNWNSSSYTTISLKERSISVQGKGSTVKGSSATIHTSGTYEISGTLEDGSIIVDVDKSVDKGTVILVLKNANISSLTSAPIYIKDAKKVVLILEEGTQNSVYGGSECITNADNEPSAAIFSKANLTITGGGALIVTADHNDGITSKDDLKITDGTLIIKAKSDGIVGKDSISIEKGSITIAAGKDGMRSTNDKKEGKGNIFIQNGQFNIIAANDAIQAFNVLQVENGRFEINSGGGYPGKSISSGNNNFGVRPGQTITTKIPEESKKGLKAGQSIIIKGGRFSISSYDDSIHSNNSIVINGGVLMLESGDDGIHADNDVVINSGEIVIKNSYEGIESANITIDGGIISIVSDDDGLNISSNKGILTIAGGEVSVTANGDGIDSNGDINMTSGTVYVNGPTAHNNAAVDYDGSFTISGGTLIAAGSSGMAQAPNNNSVQPSILMHYNSIQGSGTTISLKNTNGDVVATYSPTRQYSSVVISSPELSLGSSYTLYSTNTKIIDVALSSATTLLSESGLITSPQNMGPGGGRPGRQQPPQDNPNRLRQPIGN